jgi:SAM-dependent methyltransferase
MSLGPWNMLQLLWWETRINSEPVRIPEPEGGMADDAQVAAFDQETKRVSLPMFLFNAIQLAPFVFKGAHLLDLGCGTGGQASLFHSLFPHIKITGVDLSSAMLERFTSNNRGAERIEARRDDLSTLETFEDHSVDLIVGNECLHHMRSEDQLQTLVRAINRVLKPNGHFLFFDLLPVRNHKSAQLLIDVFPQDPIVKMDYGHSLNAAYPIEAWSRAFSPFRGTPSISTLWPLPLFGTVSSFPLKKELISFIRSPFRHLFWYWPVQQKIDFLHLSVGFLLSKMKKD